MGGSGEACRWDQGLGRRGGAGRDELFEYRESGDCYGRAERFGEGGGGVEGWRGRIRYCVMEEEGGVRCSLCHSFIHHGFGGSWKFRCLLDNRIIK